VLALLPLPVPAEYHPPLEVTLSVKVNGREVYRNHPSFTLNTFASFYAMLIGQSYANWSMEVEVLDGTVFNRTRTFERMVANYLDTVPTSVYASAESAGFSGYRAVSLSHVGAWLPLGVKVAIGDGVPVFDSDSFNELGFLAHPLARATTTVTRGSNGDRAWLTYSSTFVANGSMSVSEVGLYAGVWAPGGGNRVVDMLLFYHELIPPLQLRRGDTLVVEFTVSVGSPFTSHFLDWWLTFLPPSTPFSLNVSTRDGAATLCRSAQWLTGTQSVRDAVAWWENLQTPPGRCIVSQGLPVLELGASGDPWSIGDTGVHAPISAYVQLNSTDSMHAVSPVILKPFRVIASATRLSLIFHVYLNDAVTVREMALMVPTVECTSTSSPPRVRYVTVMRVPFDNPLATPGDFIFEIEMEWGFGSVHAGMSEPLGLVGLRYGAYKDGVNPRSVETTVYFRDRVGRPFPLKGNLTVPVLIFVTSNLTTLQDWALMRKYTAGPPQPGWMPTAAFNVTATRWEFSLTADRVIVSPPVVSTLSKALIDKYNLPIPDPYGSFRLLSHPVTDVVFACKFINVGGYDGSLLNLSGGISLSYFSAGWGGAGTCLGPCHPDVYVKFLQTQIPDPLAPIEVPPTGFSFTIYYEVPASFSSLTAYESGGKVTVEGRLVDFYGYPVSNRPVCVTGYAGTPSVLRNCTWVYTDSNGYFGADPPQSQTLLVVFPGDSVYLGVVQTITVETGAYKHRRPGEMVDLRLLVLLLLLVIIIAIVAASVYVKRGNGGAVFTVKP